MIVLLDGENCKCRLVQIRTIASLDV